MILEVAVLTLATLPFVLGTLGVHSRSVLALVVVCAIALALVHLGVTRGARWQMFPAYLLLVWLAVQWSLGLGFSVSFGMGTGLAVLLLGSTGALLVGLPLPQLPRPTGPFQVGTTVLEESYGGHEGGAQSSPRKLSIKVWYPAQKEEDFRRRTAEGLWVEFSRQGEFPWLLRALTRYLSLVRTHSFPSVPIRPSAAPYPVVIYNHGLVSISSENTLLMESLASHGYLVFSPRHADQKEEYEALTANPGSSTTRNREISRQLMQEIPRQQRSRLSLELYRGSHATRTIVERRTADTRHLVDRLAQLLEHIPGCPEGTCGEIRQVGAVGLSLGGAVADEFSKTDSRCKVVVNIDGGLYGSRLLEPMTVPYLMIYSERNAGSNDFAKEHTESDFLEVTLPGTRHLDFHDAALVLPLLRWFGMLSWVPGRRVIAKKNEAVLGMLDAVLKRPQEQSRR